MIQTFLARAKAKKMFINTDATIEDDILHTISTEELNRVIHIFESKIALLDPKKIGVVRVADLRTILQESSNSGLTHSEQNMILTKLPRDDYGRVFISEFKKVLFEARFASMKNTILETQTNDMSRHLYDLCKAEETKLVQQGATDYNKEKEGFLPLRSIINLMSSSPRLSLNRLQVMVIASEAVVEDGLVDYHSFVPIAARTIEIMFEPNALKQRAELIEKSDLSAEALVLNSTNLNAELRLYHHQ